MKIKSIVVKSKSITKQAAEAFRESVNQELLLSKYIMPTKIWRDSVQQLVNATKASSIKILNIVTGSEEGMKFIPEALLKTAFPPSTVYKTDSDMSGWDYDMEAKSFYEDKTPSADKTIGKINHLLYGPEQRLSTSTIKNWLTTPNEELEDWEISKKQDDIRELYHSLPTNLKPDTANLIASALGISMEEGTALIKSLGVTVPPQGTSSEQLDALQSDRLLKWVGVIDQLNARKKTVLDILENYDKTIANVKLKKKNGQELSEKEQRIYSKSPQTIQEEKDHIAGRLSKCDAAVDMLSNYFSISQGPLSSKRRMNTGFLNWHGNMTIFNRFGMALAESFNKSEYINSLAREINALESEKEKINSSKKTANEKKILSEKINEKLAGLKKILEWGSPANKENSKESKEFLKNFCLDSAAIIQNKILPALSEMEDVLAAANPALPTKAINFYSSLIKLIKEGKDPSKVYEAVEKELIEINDEIKSSFTDAPRVLVLKNFEKNSVLCKKKESSQHELQENRAKTSSDGKTLSGQEGYYETKPDFAQVMEAFHLGAAQTKTDAKRFPKHRVLLFVTDKKVDFSHVPAGQVKYVDLRDVLFTNEEVAESLIKFSIDQFGKKIGLRPSSLECMKTFIVGMSIANALDVVNQSILNCKSQQSATGSKIIDPKCIADQCDEISFKAAQAISPLIQRVKTNIDKKEYVVSKHNDNMPFVNEQFDFATDFRQQRMVYLRMLDEIEDKSVEINKLSINKNPTKEQRDEISILSAKINELKSMCAQYKAVEEGFGLCFDSNFHILHGKSATGKSIFPRVLAREMGFRFYQVNLSESKSKWVGESERQLRDFMVSVLKLRNVIINFDEMDGQAFCPTSGQSGAEQSSTSMRTMLQTFLEDNLDTFKKQNIFFYGSTNNLENIGPAILDRAVTHKWDNPIQDDTIVKVIKSGLARLARETFERTGGEGGTVSPLVDKEWNRLQEILIGLGDDVLKKGGMQMASVGTSYRQFVIRLQVMFRNHQRFEKMEQARKAFSEDIEKFKQTYPIFYEEWTSSGSPPDDPFPRQSFFGIEINAENFINGTKDTIINNTSQGSGATYQTTITGVSKMSSQQIKQRIARQSGEPETTEKQEDFLGELGVKTEEDMAVPAIGGVGGVGGAGDGGDKPEEKEEDPSTSAYKEKSSKNKAITPQPQQQMMQKQKEQQVESSTDYFLNSLKKSGVLGAITTKAQNIAVPQQPNNQQPAPLPAQNQDQNPSKVPYFMGSWKIVPMKD